MAHRPAPSRNCREFRTVQLGLCSTRRGEPNRYCTSCISCHCQSSSGWHTSCQLWRTKFAVRPLRFTSTTESRNLSAAELYVHLPSRCWSNRSQGQTFPGVLSDFQHHLSGTRCYKQFWWQTHSLSVFKSKLKNFFIHSGFFTQCLWSYDCMTLYKFDYYY